MRRRYGIVLDRPKQANSIPVNHAYFRLHTLYAHRCWLTNYSCTIKRDCQSIYGSEVGVDVGLTHGGIDPSAPLYGSPIHSPRRLGRACGRNSARLDRGLQRSRHVGSPPAMQHRNGCSLAAVNLPRCRIGDGECTPHDAAADLYSPQYAHSYALSESVSPGTQSSGG